MKKVVLKLDLQEAGDKRRALKTAAALPGIDEISIDIEAKTLTLVGTVDPVTVVIKLRKKSWPTDIVSVGPAKVSEKKEEPKKADEEKKEEPKKADEAAKADESPKKEVSAKENEKKESEKKAADHELTVAMPAPYRLYYPTMDASYYVHPCIEESPDACAIC